jgi:prevent-host-death family protein
MLSGDKMIQNPPRSLLGESRLSSIDLVHTLVYCCPMEVNIHEAKTHLSKLLERVASGEEVIIAKAGKPVARLVPIKPKRALRPLGLARGEFVVPDDFDAPMPDFEEDFYR